MTNLPDDCQRLLELARDAHDPVDPNTSLRVRQAVATSLAASAGVAGSLAPGALPSAHGVAGNTPLLSGAAHSTLGGKAGLVVFASKLGAVAAAAIAAAGIGYVAYPTEHSFPPSRARAKTAPIELAPQQLAPDVSVPDESAPAADGTDTPSDATPLAGALPRTHGTLQRASTATARASALRAHPEAARASVLRSHPEAARASTLTAETALLRTASEAIARGDESSALDALAQHEKEFPRGSLREERDGLRAIAECTRDTTPSTASARRFARTYPHSMLSARVAKACVEK